MRACHGPEFRQTRTIAVLFKLTGFLGRRYPLPLLPTCLPPDGSGAGHCSSAWPPLPAHRGMPAHNGALIGARQCRGPQCSRGPGGPIRVGPISELCRLTPYRRELQLSVPPRAAARRRAARRRSRRVAITSSGARATEANPGALPKRTRKRLGSESARTVSCECFSEEPEKPRPVSSESRPSRSWSRGSSGSSEKHPQETVRADPPRLPDGRPGQLRGQRMQPALQAPASPPAGGARPEDWDQP